MFRRAAQIAEFQQQLGQPRIAAQVFRIVLEQLLVFGDRLVNAARARVKVNDLRAASGFVLVEFDQARQVFLGLIVTLLGFVKAAQRDERQLVLRIATERLQQLLLGLRVAFMRGEEIAVGQTRVG